MFRIISAIHKIGRPNKRALLVRDCTTKQHRDPSNIVDFLEEVRRHWQGIVFPHVEYLETDLEVNELDLFPIDFWREFLPNVKEVR